MPKGGGVTRRRGRHDAGEYPRAADLARPGGRVAMPRLPRRHAPGETVHVVGRCHNRDCCVTTPADFLLLIAQLAAMARTDTARCWRRPTILTATHGIRAGPRNG